MDMILCTSDSVQLHTVLKNIQQQSVQQVLLVNKYRYAMLRMLLYDSLIQNCLYYSINIYKIRSDAPILQRKIY